MLAYFCVKNEKEITISLAFQFFAKYHEGNLSKTRVIMIEKDFTEMKLLEQLFNTNNRIESHNHKLKQYIRSQSHLDEAISEFITFNP